MSIIHALRKLKATAMLADSLQPLTFFQADSTVVQKKTKPPQHSIFVYQVSEINHFSKNNSASSKSGKKDSVEQCMGKWEYKWEQKRRKKFP